MTDWLNALWHAAQDAVLTLAWEIEKRLKW